MSNNAIKAFSFSFDQISVETWNYRKQPLTYMFFMRTKYI